jgi:hypothetical protein
MTIDDLDKVLEYFFNKVPERQTALKILKDVFNDNPIIPLKEILSHLIEEKYLYRQLTDSKTNNTEYGLSVPGILFYQHASTKTRPYYSLEIEKKLEKERDDKLKNYQLKNSISEMWVKKYWYVVLILGWVGGCWTDIGKETIKRKIWTDRSQSIEKFRHTSC